MESLWILASWPEDRIVKIFVEYTYFLERNYSTCTINTRGKGKENFVKYFNETLIFSRFLISSSLYTLLCIQFRDITRN